MTTPAPGLSRCPPDCDAYTPLGALQPPRVVYVPAAWCARLPAPHERLLVGDGHGRRAVAVYLGERASPYTCPPVVHHGLLIERIYDPHGGWGGGQGAT